MICKDKKTADHWLAAGRRKGVEAALKRLRGAADATRRKAGWIAEASSHYFTKLTIGFRVRLNRQQKEGLTAPPQRPASVHANPILSQLI
ncbi:hypothetical protein EMIT0158MI4_20260 [Burkholderia ambifaria]